MLKTPILYFYCSNKCNDCVKAYNFIKQNGIPKFINIECLEEYIKKGKRFPSIIKKVPSILIVYPDKQKELIDAKNVFEYLRGLFQPHVKDTRTNEQIAKDEKYARFQKDFKERDKKKDISSIPSGDVPSNVSKMGEENDIKESVIFSKIEQSNNKSNSLPDENVHLQKKMNYQNNIKSMVKSDPNANIRR